jgi:hypothetical protein
LIPYRLLAAAALAGVLTLAYFGWRDQQRDIGRQEVRAELKAAAEAQTARNRELQRAAEIRYTVTSQVREKWFVATVKEIRDASESLAACPVPESVRVLVNDAIACAVTDPPAACGTAGKVPAAGAAAGSGDGQ